MDLTRISVARPVIVVVSLVFIAFFGIIGLLKLPMQLIPDISQPQIIITSGWRSAAPQEIESVIIEPQENALKNIAGLREVRSQIRAGSGTITLTFGLDTNMQAAMLDVINALNQTPPLPLDAREPVVRLGGSSMGAASLLIRSRLSNSQTNISDHQKLIRDQVATRLNRIPGVARVNLSSERAQELRITFDPQKAAAVGIELADIKQIITTAQNSSGGQIALGRKLYTIRFSGQYRADNLENMIIGYSRDRAIYLRDVAEVEMALADRQRFTLRNGEPAFYMTVERSIGVNTIDLIDELNSALDELNQGVLKQAGLQIDLSYDSSIHIRNAIAMVNGNLGLGVILALLTLWCFLRGWRATLVMATTIPVALLVGFIALYLFNRSLNVISLAALAFSVGMVLDAAVIIQENILRLKGEGVPNREAVLKGAAQVRGALLTSTATSVAIFIPILSMKGLEGQLFYDLSLTLSIAVVSSMIAALTVIPMISAHWHHEKPRADKFVPYWRWLTSMVMKLTRTTSQRLVCVGVLLGGSISLSIWLLPKADFLPRAPTDGFAFSVRLPSGSNLDYIEQELAAQIKQRITPYFSGEKQPSIKSYNLYTIAGNTGGFIYATDPKRVEKLMQVAREHLFADLPDAKVHLTRGTMINMSGGGGGRSISMDLQGADMSSLMKAAETAVPIIQDLIPGAGVRVLPGLTMSQPEINLLPDDRRISQASIDRSDVAEAMQSFSDGLFLGEYFDGNQRYDVILRSEGWNSIQQLSQLPIYTNQAGLQPLGELAAIEYDVGPGRLLRVEGQRTVTLSVIPPDKISLEQAITTLQRQVQPVLMAQMPSQSRVLYRGNADKLAQSIEDMQINFLLAIFTLFVLLVAQFKSVRDSLAVLSVMPVAMLGGVLSLQVLNLFTFQSFDLLTMIGFLILFGLVVNNSLLLVDHTRRQQRQGIQLTQAVTEALLVRARPIYIGSLTSIVGMLPLMLVPGIGSEIYRGLAAVIVGGMLSCVVFTPILLTSFLRMGKDTLSRNLALRSQSTGEAVRNNPLKAAL